MKLKLLAVITPPSMYHGCSTWKTFWEENFTPADFTPVSMKHGGRCNVRKHRRIKNGEKYNIMDISLKFGSLDKMEITYSEPKYYLVRPRKVLINYKGLKTIVSSKKNKKEMYYQGV